MEQDIRLEWAHRTICAVDKAFPDGAFLDWPICQKFLTQAKTCARIIDEGELRSEKAERLLNAGHLLNNAGFYLHSRGLLREAQPLFEKAKTIYEKALTPNDPPARNFVGHFFGNI
jgi:hypothetical protein